MVVNIKFEYHGQQKSIALFAGIQTKELESILQNTFHYDNSLVGFVGEVKITNINCSLSFTLLSLHIFKSQFYN